MKTPEFGMRVRLKAGFLMQMQAQTGVAFNLKRAQLALRIFDKGMRNIERIVRPHLPRVYLSPTDLKKKYPPKTKVKNMKSSPVHVTHTNHLINWAIREGHSAFSLIGKHIGEPVVGLKKADGSKDLCLLTLNHLDTFKPDDTAEFNLWSNSHMMQLKNHLQDVYGWRPTIWNHKKGPDGKFLYDKRTREKIKVSPKFQDKGRLCLNLESLGEDVRFVSGIVKWVQLKHRRGILTKKDGTGGWIGDERVQADGRISAKASAITNTMRQKHTKVCNVPTPATFMGGILRGCLEASEGMKAGGYDAGSLEAVLKSHYAFPYDNGEYAAKIADPDYDEHTEMQIAGGLATRKEAKPVNYGAQYMQKEKGLAETTGWPLEKARHMLKVYWEVNHGWKSCLDKLEKHWELMGKKGIVCPLSGLYLHSRSKNSLGSLLVQHSGAFIMDLAGVIMDKWLGGITCEDIPHYKYKGKIARRVIYYHDEYMWEAHPDIIEEVIELGKESIREAARVVGLRVPLDADGLIGDNWKECH